jgi:hypothetical protein
MNTLRGWIAGLLARLAYAIAPAADRRAIEESDPGSVYVMVQSELLELHLRDQAWALLHAEQADDPAGKVKH